MNLSFASPHLLWLLLIVPLAAILLGRAGTAAAVKFPAVALARQIAAFVRSKPGRFLVNLRLLILTLLILGLARPQFESGINEIEASGIDIVLAVDLSTSMWAHDFEIKGKPTDRLTVVKKVMEDFIGKRPNDRIGIIAFAGAPYLVSPLTLNHEWLQGNLERLQIGLTEDGTAIGSAIGSSANRLRAQKAKSRIVILLTDGANNQGQISPLAAAEAAAAFGIKVYTIGAGREGRIPYPYRFDHAGRPVRDKRGKVALRTVESVIDIESLKEIASVTGARFFRATDAETLGEIYDAIDELEKTEIKLKYRASFNDVFMWPVSAALVMFLVEQILANTRYRRLP
jgi:Ca-activated chloride channel family protein